MLRRLTLLAMLIGGGWLIYTRTRRPAAVDLGDTADLRPDEARGGVRDTLTAAAGGATAAARRVAAQARSVIPIGKDDDDAPLPAETPVTPDFPPQGVEPADIAGGYAPADPGRDAAPTPDLYRPVEAPADVQAGAGPVQRTGDGATANLAAAPAVESASSADAASGEAGTATAARSAPAPARAPAEAAEEINLVEAVETARAEVRPGTAHAAPIAQVATITESPDLPAEDEAQAETVVKGNIRADGEKIYHMPGDPAYERVHPEALFQTSEEAEAAGFRRAGRPQPKDDTGEA